MYLPQAIRFNSEVKIPCSDRSSTEAGCGDDKCPISHTDGELDTIVIVCANPQFPRNHTNDDQQRAKPKFIQPLDFYAAVPCSRLLFAELSLR